MQKIDWLRDMEEAQAYPEAKVVLREWTDSYSSTIVKVMETFTDRRDVGWMPVDVDYYNAWKAEREARPHCNVCGKYADGFPDGWIGGISSPWICPECQTKYCPTCNGTGKIQGWDLDCPDCTGTVAKKETVEKPMIEKPCLSCAGSGSMPRGIPCPTCEGGGTIMEEWDHD